MGLNVHAELCWHQTPSLYSGSRICSGGAVGGLAGVRGCGGWGGQSFVGLSRQVKTRVGTHQDA